MNTEKYPYLVLFIIVVVAALVFYSLAYFISSRILEWVANFNGWQPYRLLTHIILEGEYHD